MRTQDHIIHRLLTGRGLGISIGDTMRSDEIRAGYKIVRPGEARWLPAEDWDRDCVISLDGLTVRLVAIHALKPGTGAFTRLLSAVEAAGLRPVVLEPTVQFEQALRRRGWKSRRYGIGVNAETRWRPPRRS